MNIIELNDDVLSNIVEYIDPYDYMLIKYTCKTFYNLMAERFEVKKLKDYSIYKSINYLLWAKNNGYKIKKKYMFSKSIIYGDLDLIEYLYYIYGNKYMTPYHYELCLELRYVSKFIALIDMKCPYNKEIYYNYICNDKLKAIFTSTRVYKDLCFNISADFYYNNPDDWIKKQFIFNQDDLMNAIVNNNIEKVKWAINSIDDLKNDICEMCVIANNIDIMIWACDNDFKLTKDVFVTAIKKGNKRMIELLKNYNCPFNWFVLDTAITYDDFDTVKWLLYKRCQINNWILADLHFKQRYDILEYLKKDFYYSRQLLRVEND